MPCCSRPWPPSRRGGFPSFPCSPPPSATRSGWDGGPRPGRPAAVVGVGAAPCFALVAGLLAILKAGGAYLALDPGHPPERLAKILADSGARLVLAEPAVAERLPAVVRLLPLSDPPVDAQRSPAGAPPPTPACPAQPDNAAYVLYTSGSTGRPQGGVGSPPALVNRLRFHVAA